MRYLSVCSGIEAATVAWRPLGWRAAAFAEIESFPSALLAYHYPEVPNLGDMTGINGAEFRGKVDVLVGGTPCQSFSVAGMRRGLRDERGNLALEFVRIADACDPPFIVWENVPGVLSDRGNAFGYVLAALAGEEAPFFPPGRKWTNAGYVLGPKRRIAWRVLDAQYFGLAQRRRRVFLVACPRNGADPRAVLFESEGVRGHPSPGKKAGPNLAGALTARFGRNGGAANDDFDAGRIVTQALTGRLGCGGPDDKKAQGGFSVAGTPGNAVAAFGGNNTSGGIEVAPALNAHGGGSRRLDFASETFIAYPLRGEGFDAGEDGTGRQNLVVTPLQEPGKRTGKSTNGPRVGIEIGNTGNPMFTMQAGAQHGVCMAFTERGRKEGRTLEAQPDLAYALTNPGSGGRTHSRQILDTQSSVRRLTPRECERLQGFPDDYTLIPCKRPFAGLPKAVLERSYRRYLRRMARRAKTPLPLDEIIRLPDGPRYKALGNSMAVPVMRWIGERIAMHARDNRPEAVRVLG